MPGPFIAAALLPALVITLLFFFDHSVSSQMAQQPEFSLEKPSAGRHDHRLWSDWGPARQWRATPGEAASDPAVVAHTL